MSLHMNATGIHVRPTGRVIAPTKKNAVVPTARCGAPATRLTKLNSDKQTDTIN